MVCEMIRELFCALLCFLGCCQYFVIQLSGVGEAYSCQHCVFVPFKGFCFALLFCIFDHSASQDRLLNAERE